MRTPIFALVISLATAASARSDAQVPNPSQAPSRLKSSPLLRSPVWGRPLTVLDYLLMQVYSRLDERARNWETSEHSGLWTSSQPTGSSVSARAFLDQQSGQVVLGLDIHVDKFTKAPAEVCASIIDLSVADAAAAGKTEREYR